MSERRSIDEVHSFHPVLVEAQYRILWCMDQLRREAVASGQGGRLLDLLWEVVQRDPLHTPVEWVHLLRKRADRVGAKRLSQVAGLAVSILDNIDVMMRGRADVPDRIRRSSSLLELLERRCSERVAVEVTVEWALHDRKVTGLCHNLSEGGMLVEIEPLLLVGTEAPIVLYVPPPLGPIHARARVVWASDPADHRAPLLGAEFAHTSREARHRITFFLKRVTDGECPQD